MSIPQNEGLSPRAASFNNDATMLLCCLRRRAPPTSKNTRKRHRGQRTARKSRRGAACAALGSFESRFTSHDCPSLKASIPDSPGAAAAEAGVPESEQVEKRPASEPTATGAWSSTPSSVWVTPGRQLEPGTNRFEVRRLPRRAPRPRAGRAGERVGGGRGVLPGPPRRRPEPGRGTDGPGPRGSRSGQRVRGGRLRARSPRVSAPYG